MRALLLVLTATAAVACSKSAPAPGTVTAIPQVCAGADGSRVRLSGTLRYRRGLMSFCSNFGGKMTCDMALYESAERPPDFDLMRKPTGPEPVHARLSVPVGGAPGEMEQPPKKFTEADIKVHLADGKTAGDGTPVTVDGKLSVIPPDPAKPDAPKQCYVTVEWATTP
jgi:hypothetical protein